MRMGRWGWVGGWVGVLPVCVLEGGTLAVAQVLEETVLGVAGESFLTIGGWVGGWVEEEKVFGVRWVDGRGVDGGRKERCLE